MPFRQYQKEDIKKWMTESNYRGAFMWEPGLGKTYAATRIIKRLADTDKMKRVLVLCPATLLDMWEEECLKQGIPENEIFRHKPMESWSSMTKKRLAQECMRFDLPYEGGKKDLLRRLREGKESGKISAEDIRMWPKPHHKYILGGYELTPTIYTPQRLRAENIDTFILDESHNVKSHNSSAFKLLQKVVAREHKILLLSGTPFPQGRIDTWSQMSLIKPGSLGRNITQFRKDFCYVKNPEYFTYGVRTDRFQAIDDILYKSCSFRKTTDEIDLPPMTSITLPYTLTQAQRKFYKQVKVDKVLKYKDEEIPLALPGVRMLMLQQISSGLLDMKITSVDEEVEIKIDIEKGKINHKEELLIQQLKNLPEGEQALIWVNFVKTGERITKLINKAFKTTVCKGVNGSITGSKRTGILKEYEEKKIRFIVAHPKTLGTGFNIFSKTKYMYWYELTTDFAVFEQANRRIWRIGQTNKSFMYVFEGKGSIDSHIHKAVKLKKDVQEYIYENYLKDET